ncbi:hypothetical protein [Helicovermis profundi]|uniref:Uncharacterized protein n=1 Tax=Helicovermis profundi TaxID=3065157 RepID=A0AAU9EL32_9FIRM|nr:hypothetical protein HLPR_02820 [Clostridia bacterium S502]
MANRMTSIIMNNIVDKCLDYNRKENNIRANKENSTQNHLSENEVKTLSSLINKGKTVKVVKNDSNSKVATRLNKSGVIKLEDIIGKNNNVKTSGSTNEKRKVSGKVNLDDYLKNLKNK